MVQHMCLLAALEMNVVMPPSRKRWYNSQHLPQCQMGKGFVSIWWPKESKEDTRSEATSVLSRKKGQKEERRRWRLVPTQVVGATLNKQIGEAIMVGSPPPRCDQLFSTYSSLIYMIGLRIGWESFGQLVQQHIQIVRSGTRPIWVVKQCLILLKFCQIVGVLMDPQICQLSCNSDM